MEALVLYHQFFQFQLLSIDRLYLHRQFILIIIESSVTITKEEFKLKQGFWVIKIPLMNILSSIKVTPANNNFISMDQILENSYFRTNIKDKYSFPKSDRFPNIKPKYTIDFFQSSSIQKPRSTSFGYGSKFDFFRNTKKGPSPFDYSVQSQDRLKQGLSFGRGREEIVSNSYIDAEKIKTPRVGNYHSDYSVVKKREPSCTIVARRPQDSFIKITHNPEPCKYNPSDNFYSRRKRSAEFAFGSAKRFDYGQNHINKMVGPGSYAIKNPNDSKLGTIGHADRKTYAVEQIQKSITPGPKYIVK